MLTSRRGLANVFVAVTGMIVTLFVNVGVLPPDVALYGILALSFYFVFLVRRNRMLLYEPWVAIGWHAWNRSRVS